MFPIDQSRHYNVRLGDHEDSNQVILNHELHSNNLEKSLDLWVSQNLANECNENDEFLLNYLTEK